MSSVNTAATHKFVIVLNEKSPIGKLFSAVGQIAMSLQAGATAEQKVAMDFIPFTELITLSTCSFVVLKGTASQILALHQNAKSQGVLSSIFTSTMSYNGVEEDLFEKTKNTPLDQTEPYGIGLFGKIEDVSPLTKKFSVFR